MTGRCAGGRKRAVSAALQQDVDTHAEDMSTMVAVQEFQPTTNWTRNTDGSIRNKVRLLERLTLSKFRMEVVVLAGRALPEPFITVSNLSILNS